MMMLMIGSISIHHIQAQESNGQQAIAFPGCEGFGKYAQGGRGGKILTVSNLEDAGPGSLREAVSKNEKRIIIFGVSGTIHLLSPLNIKGNVTILGQSAPGEGICVADQPVKFNGDQIIVRYMRFRMGDRFQSQKGMVDGSGGDDAVGGKGNKFLVVDHCSMSWSTDEVFSVYGGDSSTLQWNLIAEPLNYSYHFETGDKDWEHHGYGGIWGGTHLSAHHNLFAHCVSRNPRFNGSRLGSSSDFVDFRNNVIYDWGHKSVYGGENGKYNVINNYYKPGPNTHKNAAKNILDPSKTNDLPYGTYFLYGNYLEGNREVNANNMTGVTPGVDPSIFIKMPHDAAPINTEAPANAYKSVMLSVGASYQRDTLDQRIINDMLAGKGNVIDVQGGYPHGTPYEVSKSAWPTLNQGVLPIDSDKDGIPDAWELEHQLDPKNPADAGKSTLQFPYANIEVYLNSIVK